MKKKYCVVIPFNLPWEWSTDYTNQTAFELENQGHTVICYMWSDTLTLKEYFIHRKLPILIKRYTNNIYQFYPILFIPFRRFKKVVQINEWLNILLVKLLILFLDFTRHFNLKILWVFDPQTQYLSTYFNNWKLIYDCVDFFGGATKDLKIRREVFKNEEIITKKADFVFANSLALFNHLKPMRKDLVLVAQGFRLDSFVENLKKKGPKLKRNKRSLIGFVGAVNARIDYELLYKLVQKHPEWDFVLWGKLLEEHMFTNRQKILLLKLEKMPNVLRGQSPKEEIPSIVKQFDVGMIPYDPNNEFNKNCYPMKIFEYFYLRKPVISTEITELHRFSDLVFISNKTDDWENYIVKILRKKLPEKLKKKARKYAIENSWESKLGIILRTIRNEV